MTTENSVRKSLPGWRNKRPGVARYIRPYVRYPDTASGWKSVSWSTYLTIAHTIGLDMGETVAKVHRICYMQLYHRLYALGTGPSKRKKYIQNATNEPPIMRGTIRIPVRRKPSKRLLKKIKFLYPYTFVHAADTSEPYYRWVFVITPIEMVGV